MRGITASHHPIRKRRRNPQIVSTVVVVEEDGPPLPTTVNGAHLVIVTAVRRRREESQNQENESTDPRDIENHRLRGEDQVAKMTPGLLLLSLPLQSNPLLQLVLVTNLLLSLGLFRRQEAHNKLVNNDDRMALLLKNQVQCQCQVMVHHKRVVKKDRGVPQCQEATLPRVEKQDRALLRKDQALFPCLVMVLLSSKVEKNDELQRNDRGLFPCQGGRRLASRADDGPVLQTQSISNNNNSQEQWLSRAQSNEARGRKVLTQDLPWPPVLMHMLCRLVVWVQWRILLLVFAQKIPMFLALEVVSPPQGTHHESVQLPLHLLRHVESEVDKVDGRPAATRVHPKIHPGTLQTTMITIDSRLETLLWAHMWEPIR